ncbi:hypothetical protein NU219Hw_g8581t2 [Hortaea werneckii]
MTVAEIRQSNEFISDVNATFDKLGHFVWPAGDRRSIEWLIEGRPDNEYYPRDLFCHKQDDQDKLRTTFQELIVAKCRSARVSSRSQPENERLPEPIESGKDRSESSHNTALDKACDVTSALDDNSSTEQGYPPFPESSGPNASPSNHDGHGLVHQQGSRTFPPRSSKRLSQRHDQNQPQDAHNDQTRSWTIDPDAGTPSPLKRRRQPSGPSQAPAPTANMSRGRVTLQMDSQKFKALLSGGQSSPAISGDSSETMIKKEVVKNAVPSPAAFNHCANSPPVIDLTDETPDILSQGVQSAVAMDAGRASTVPPVPASLVRNLTMAANVGHQSESNSVQPAASEVDTIAVATGRLGKRIADSLGAVFSGEASHADVDASEEQCNAPRPADPERCMSRQTVGAASDDDDEDFDSSSDDDEEDFDSSSDGDEEDLYSTTPPPPNVPSRDTTAPTATARMLQPEPLGDRDRPSKDGSAREQDGYQADQTRLGGAGGQLASPVSTGAESRHRVASQVADESQHADSLSSHIEQMAKDDAAIKEGFRRIRQKLREQERTLREEGDAASRRIAERTREYEQLERQSQDVARQTEAVRQIGQPSSADDG